MTEMESYGESVQLERLREMAEQRVGDLVKAVVDVERVEEPAIQKRIAEIVDRLVEA